MPIMDTSRLLFGIDVVCGLWVEGTDPNPMCIGMLPSISWDRVFFLP